MKDHTNDPGFQAKLMKELGFDGMELMGLDQIGEKLAELDQQKLQLFMVYIRIDLEKPQHFDPRMFSFIREVKNKGVTLWLHILSEKLKPSDPAGDSLCVPIIREIADFANDYGVNVALYPHVNFWLEKVDDSVRLTKKINRRNVGAVFNFCHYLKGDEKNLLEEKLVKAIPYLAAVSVNGADDGSTSQMGWDRLIQPLGKGSFDVLKVLQILKNNRYSGPGGLQCYSISGKPEDFLKISIAGWKDYLKKLN
ncbi:MAG: sugar phosphate isomerase/epimerase [Bacteroidales bacterium]|nr:sugar phosphate isomerase/epimerase [Bacteroidales bacterium]